MVKSEIIKFRVSKDVHSTILMLKKIWQFPTISKTVSALIRLGINYKEARDKEIAKIEDRVKELNLMDYELTTETRAIIALK